MRRIAGEIDPLHARMRGQPRRHAAGVGALALHAQRESLDAAHRQVAFERAQHGTEGARQRAQRIGVRAIGDHDAAQHVAVSGQIFGDAVHAEVRAQFERTDQQRRGEGIVHHQGRAGLVRDLRDRGRSPHAQQRIGNGLHHDAARPGLGDRGAQRVQIADVGEADAHCPRLEHVHQQADGGAVQGARRHDGLAAVGQRAENRHCSAAMPEAHASGRTPPSSAHISSSSAAADGLS